MSDGVSKEAAAAPVLRVRIDEDLAELCLEFASGVACQVEGISACASLERDDAGRVLRLRLKGLRESWRTDMALSPAVVCRSDGCHRMEGPDGRRMFLLGVGLPESERPVLLGEDE